MTATPKRMPAHTTLTPIVVGPEDPAVSLTINPLPDGSLALLNRDGNIVLTPLEVERLTAEIAAPKIAAEVFRMLGLER